MTDFNIISVIPSYGKADEWPILSEKFLVKAKWFGFKDLLLGKFSTSKEDESLDEVSEIEKKMSRIIDLNEITYTELILSIRVKVINGKIAFNLVRG
jgi:hypothetical protein